VLLVIADPVCKTSIPGSNPGGASNLRSRLTRRLPAVALAKAGTPAFRASFGWQANTFLLGPILEHEGTTRFDHLHSVPVRDIVDVCVVLRVVEMLACPSYSCAILPGTFRSFRSDE